ncbi:hypothetical protein MGYG_05732 [Nannizzia gypsea CBS 118893]|uniref:Uncharacterized protein n=1 Tax=Arthroderma gypseum (strain ATCC MYA-4604 / CBS 118893) TaxID=535722 RepID=E4UXJ9_ARTGP|nr:hypothetical protein MGYG_05732 [Nannizzia gypsea CBS 118893]EFR02733.1 hypothetical protein MGYG_05732 [Nannizzia gypsea CBS 118893]
MSSYIDLIRLNGTFMPGPVSKPPPRLKQSGRDTPSMSSTRAQAGSLRDDAYPHDGNTTATKQDSTTCKYNNDKDIAQDLQGIGSWMDDHSLQ